MTKRIVSLIVLIVLIAGIFMPMTAMAEKTRYVYTSNGKTLNLRKNPHAYVDNVIANIPFGAAVRVLDRLSYPAWSYVEYNGTRGYVLNRYLVDTKPEKPAAKPAQTAPEADGSLYQGFKPASYLVEVHASTPGGHVNLRWAPSKKAAVQAKMADGAMLQVIAQNQYWAQVTDPQTSATGFMLRSFLNVCEADLEG